MSSVGRLLRAAGLGEDEARSRAQGRRHLELVRRFEDHGDYHARDALIQRRVYDDTSSATLNDYGHYLGMVSLGRRIHLPQSKVWKARRGYSRAPGFAAADGRRINVRVRRPAAVTPPVFFSADRAAFDRDLDTLLTLVFNTDLTVYGAWLVPREVAEAYREPRGLRERGA